MKYILLFCSFLLGFFTCEAQIKNDKKDITGSRMLSYTTIIDSSGKKFVFDSTYYDTYSRGDITIHGLPYHYSSSIDDSVILEEIRYHYLVLAKDSLFGYDYDNHENVKIKRLPADSILRILHQNSTANSQFNELFTLNECKLITSRFDADSGIFYETYQVNSKTDTAVAKCFLEFDLKPKGEIHSGLLKEMEAVKKMNLSKMRILTGTAGCNCNCNFGYDIIYSIEPVTAASPLIKKLFTDYSQ